MRNMLKSTGEKSLAACEKSKKMNELLINTNKELQTQNIVLTHKVEEQNNEISQLKKELEELKRQKSLVEVIEISHTGKYKDIEELKNLLNEQINIQKSFQQKYQDVF